MSFIFLLLCYICKHVSLLSACDTVWIRQIHIVQFLSRTRCPSLCYLMHTGCCYCFASMQRGVALGVNEWIPARLCNTSPHRFHDKIVLLVWTLIFRKHKISRCNKCIRCIGTRSHTDNAQWQWGNEMRSPPLLPQSICQWSNVKRKQFIVVWIVANGTCAKWYAVDCILHRLLR